MLGFSFHFRNQKCINKDNFKILSNSISNVIAVISWTYVLSKILCLNKHICIMCICLYVYIYKWNHARQCSLTTQQPWTANFYFPATRTPFFNVEGRDLLAGLRFLRFVLFFLRYNLHTVNFTILKFNECLHLYAVVKPPPISRYRFYPSPQAASPCLFPLRTS